MVAKAFSSLKTWPLASNVCSSSLHVLWRACFPFPAQQRGTTLQRGLSLSPWKGLLEYRRCAEDSVIVEMAADNLQAIHTVLRLIPVPLLVAALLFIPENGIEELLHDSCRCPPDDPSLVFEPVAGDVFASVGIHLFRPAILV